jgi:hypothetical protein
VLEVIPGLPDRLLPEDEAAKIELEKRTQTNLYNEMPPWLQHAHRELDDAVAVAYGWDWPLADDAILKRLFELNQQRALPLVIRPAAQKPDKQMKPKHKAQK